MITVGSVHTKAGGTTSAANPPRSLRRGVSSPGSWPNRVSRWKEITDQMELARHGAHTFWGLLARIAATIAAHTLLITCVAEA